MTNKYVEYAESLVRGICSKPEEVKVTRQVDEMGVLLSIQVAQEDMGQIIGRGGKTAESIRYMIKIAGILENARVSVKILEPDGSESRKP